MNPPTTTPFLFGICVRTVNNRRALLRHISFIDKYTIGDRTPDGRFIDDLTADDDVYKVDGERICHIMYNFQASSVHVTFGIMRPLLGWHLWCHRLRRPPFGGIFDYDNQNNGDYTFEPWLVERRCDGESMFLLPILW